MTTQIQLTKLQSLAYQQATRESAQMVEEIEEKRIEAAKLQEKIEAMARIASRRYSSTLAEIASEHGLKEIPLDAKLVVEDGQTFFNWTPVKKKAKKKVAKKKAGRPKGAKNKPKAKGTPPVVIPPVS